MEYYIYLLQIFGGGNPKIHEVIKAYGNARLAYEHISSGDMSHIPSNRHEYVRRASLERSKVIMDYCAGNNIGIVTIDDRNYPEQLKNIYNPPVLLFTAGDINCLQGKLAVSIVGPRKPFGNAIRLAENICYNLARSNIVLVSGFVLGIDRIAHNNSIRHSKPTVAVLACGITIDYPNNSFGLRKNIIDNGGLILSELLPDTPCNSDYFKFRNRIISGLSKGTVVIGGYNGSGSLITANHAFEQDREVFFTIPDDTLDKKYSRVIRFLRDGAHSVYDFYDIINEFYPTYRDIIDDTYLDKEQLTSFVMHEDVRETPPAEDEPTVCEAKEPEPAKKEDVRETAPAEGLPTVCKVKEPELAKKEEKKPLPKVKAADAPRFKITGVKDKEKEIDYFRVTPENVLKKRKKAGKPATLNDTAVKERIPIIAPIAEADNTDVSEAEPVTDKEEKQSGKIAEAAENASGAAEVLGIIANSDGVTLDTLLSACSLSFGELSEILADLEISGAVSCGAGGIYTVKKER